ncbi:MAG: cytochrome C [Bacteroidetes bacterium]|nr:cytochrome C [Bacteroidota bacterium]
MKKWILRILVILVIFIAGGLAYLKLVLPKIDKAENIQIKSTPEMIQRGAYLANHVCVCMDCHSTRDWSKFSGPIVQGTLGKGGEKFTRELGFPGIFYSKNLTPSELKNWTDGEIIRAITSGVTKDGKALFPIMPYLHYNKMDKNDIIAIVAYLRTLQPIENKTPDAEIDFPMNFILNTIPQNASFSTRPSQNNLVDYGAYLVNASGCVECHTQANKGQIDIEKAFSGGRKFDLTKDKVIVSSNITTDIETGIGSWTEEIFVSKFKYYADTANITTYTSPKDFQTIMPWTMYAGMDTFDLKAIYAYLKTIKPIKNKVVSNPISE